MELRSRLVEYINTADERLLRIVKAVFESYQEESDDVVAFRANGKAVTRKEYIERNQQAVIDYHKGTFKTNEELKQKYKAQ